MSKPATFAADMLGARARLYRTPATRARSGRTRATAGTAPAPNIVTKTESTPTGRTLFGSVRDGSVTALVDDREPRSVLRRLGAHGWEQIRLDYGDYWLVTATTTVGIERKTVGDLLHSLGDGRVDAQLVGLIGAVDIPILLVQGWLRADPDGKVMAGGKQTGWDYESVLNKLQTFQELGVRLQLCGEHEDWLLRRLDGLAAYFSKSDHRLAQKRGALDILRPERDPAVLMLAQVPGIGTDRARQLIKHFGSVLSIALATETDLTGCSGIGRELARSIQRTMRGVTGL